MTIRAQVAGVGHYLPARVVPNAEFEAWVGSAAKAMNALVEAREAATDATQATPAGPSRPAGLGEASAVAHVDGGEDVL